MTVIPNPPADTAASQKASQSRAVPAPLWDNPPPPPPDYGVGDTPPPPPPDDDSSEVWLQAKSSTPATTNGELVCHAVPDRVQHINAVVEPDEHTLLLEIKEKHAELLAIGRKSLQLCLGIGERLCLLKDKVGHGEWEKCLREQLDMKPRTASNYMRVYNERKSLPGASDVDCGKSAESAEMTLSGALKLIQSKSQSAAGEQSASGSERKASELEDQVNILPGKISRASAHEEEDLESELVDFTRADGVILRMDFGKNTYIEAGLVQELFGEILERVPVSEELQAQLQELLLDFVFGLNRIVDTTPTKERSETLSSFIGILSQIPSLATQPGDREPDIQQEMAA